MGHRIKVTLGLGISLVFLLLNVNLCYAQTPPVIGLHKNTPRVTAFTNARIIVSPKIIISIGTMVLRDDRIEAVGAGASIPPDAVIHDMVGKSIYPGFIDLYTHYGIQRDSYNRLLGASHSSQESSILHWNPSVRPELRIADFFQPDNENAQNFRKNGFTLVASFPEDGIFRGSGILVLPGDAQQANLIIDEDFGQGMSLKKLSRANGYPNSLMGAMALVRQTFLDAGWYANAWSLFRRAPRFQTMPETNISLEALERQIRQQKPMVFESENELDFLRIDALSHEFGVLAWVIGTGHEYRRLEALKATRVKTIIPIAFPCAPEILNPSEEIDIPLSDLKHWDSAPENPARLHKTNIEFAITSNNLQTMDDFLPNLRMAIRRGLPADAAMAALTTIPAGWSNISAILGTLEPGKMANCIVADGDIFDDETNIIETWIAGKKYDVRKHPYIEIAGRWSLRVLSPRQTISATLSISESDKKAKAVVQYCGKDVPVSTIETDKHQITIVFSTDSLGYSGICRLTGIISGNSLAGYGVWSDGTSLEWEAHQLHHDEEKSEKRQPVPVHMAEFPVVYPDGAFGMHALPEQPEYIFIRNATIWTCSPEGTLHSSDMLIHQGTIISIGDHLSAPPDAKIIDCSGKHVTPGIIDAHSHLAILRGVNEGSHAITSETRIADIIDCDDINIYRQLAGGVTTAEIIHGSANPIGGQTATIKLRWGALPHEMLFDHSTPGIKLALGENVKRSNWVDPETARYPRTRMGVDQILRDAFRAALDYRRELENYAELSKSNPDIIPPRRNLRYEALLEALDKKRQVQCHAYRQDEILATLRLAEEMGFRIDIFIHILEGYKVCEIMREHGAMPSTFSDWWAYKFEVYDAIPFNGALMHDQGLLVSFNSDDYELARRLNTEAAKAVKYGGVPPEEALKFVTLNPAKQLKIDEYVGSLESGKDADFVIWSGSPLSTYTMCEQTWIDGRNYFSIEEDRMLREKAKTERTRLVVKISKQKDKAD